MGSSPAPSTAASPEFLAVFRSHADASGTMSFAKFMELALYHPGVGYYRRAQPRIGYAPGTDFFTASTSGAIFGEVVSAAAVKLLRDVQRDPTTHTWVEIGAETAGGVLEEVVHPFAAVRTIRVGEPFELSGDSVVFSNELFDAQPCVRTRFRHGRWHEIGVRLESDRLVEVELPLPFADPQPAAEGYEFDRPLAAKTLAAKIAAEPWSGLFVAIDYGKTLHDLREETPRGTLRAYYQHTQSNDVLARPGQQDLTCHVCWDWLTDALRQHGFAEPRLDFQESFLIGHAGAFIEQASAKEAQRLSQRKLALFQLLHPAHLGQKFQVLHALR
jgi:SAM-dependent MidA family methyltransferase